MSFKDRFSKAINAFLDDDEEKSPAVNNNQESSREEEEYINSMDECIEKGNEFEKYVANKFSPKYFSISEWTTDMMRKHGRYVESDSRPDLTMRYKPTNELFCVECKFRSGLYKGGLQWCKPNQLARYWAYSEDTRLQLFIVIGLGGASHNPERMFCIPIEEARYPNLYPSVYENFERDPKSYFFWKNGVLE
jgi:hypothetical protein